MRIHVMSRGNKWAVIKDVNNRASKICDTKIEAIDEARKLNGDVIVHKKNGTVESWEIKE